MIDKRRRLIHCQRCGVKLEPSEIWFCDKCRNQWRVPKIAPEGVK